MTSTSSVRGRRTAADREAGESEPTGEPVLRVEGVERSFGDLTVLEGVTTDLHAGEVAALVGPNGSGKTTLIRVVAGLLDADAGHVAVESDAPRPVGYLPQSPRFRPQFTVAETLSFYASLVEGGVGVDEAIEQVGLAAVRDRRIEALSGGMIRLVGLAQALLGDPALLVLDEPTSSLDPAMTEYIYDVIAGLAAERGTTVLLSTHDLDVSRVADRVLLLDRGRLVVDDAPAAVREAREADSLAEAFLEEVGHRRTVQTGVTTDGGGVTDEGGDGGGVTDERDDDSEAAAGIGGDDR